MAKRRKTRQEKIILQLKRELAQRQAPKASSNIKKTPRQGAILKKKLPQPPKLKKEKKTDKSILSYNQGLVKKDLFKTLALTLIILGLEFMLYLRLR